MHVLITGPPGIGKTTLVKKICAYLTENKIRHQGFYTQEIRSNGSRVGFQIVTVDGKTGPLSSVSVYISKLCGQYGVEVEEFENLALPQFTDLPRGNQILILDEIGKMELFSEKFKSAVDSAFKITGLSIIATIPIQKGKPIPFLENIRSNPNSKLFIIDKSNRDEILRNIIDTVLSSTKE